MTLGAGLALAALAVLVVATVARRLRHVADAPGRADRADRVTQDTIDAAAVKAHAQLLAGQIRANLARIASNVDVWPDDKPPPTFTIPALPRDLEEERRGRRDRD